MEEDSAKQKILKIVRYSEVPSTEVERIGKTDVALVVMLEDMSTWILQIPKEDLTEDLVKKVLREKIASRDKWQGKTLEY